MAWAAANTGKHFCQCGCGEPIPVKVEHFNVGVPRFLLGHNAKVMPPRAKPAIPRVPCLCGCGELASSGKRFRSGHNNLGQKRSDETRRKLSEAKVGDKNPQFGKRSPTYAGGRTTHAAGYVQVLSPDHPFKAGSTGYVMEHRLVMESHLRATNPASPFLTEVGGELYLKRDLHVHHINGVKADNRVENLEVLTIQEHTDRHRAEMNAARWPQTAV